MAGSGGGKKRRDKENHYRHAAILHATRQAILHLLSDGRELGASEVAAELDEPLGRISYHLRVLIRRGALKAVARGPAPALYSWSPQAHWVRKMLDEYGSEDPS
jgi:DNA-binding transcriptional ArsR family regulator